MEAPIIEKKIIQIVSDYLKIDSNIIQPESTWNDLGADSLDRVEIVLRIETELNITIEGNYPSSVYSMPLKVLVADVKLFLAKKMLDSDNSAN